MSVIDTIRHGAWTAEIMLEECPPSPMEDNDCHGLFVRLPSRNWSLGHVEVDPERLEIQCDPEGPDGNYCEDCYGSGFRPVSTYGELAAQVANLHDAASINGEPAIWPVRMGDHSNVRLYIGAGPSQFDPGGWDSGLVGFYLYTDKMLDEWGSPRDYGTLSEMARAEVEQYGQYINGEVYGYRIVDPNGELVDDDDLYECAWGYIGWEAVAEAATFELRHQAEQGTPEPVRMVRLSLGDVDRILKAVGYDDDHDDPLRDNLRAARDDMTKEAF